MPISPGALRAMLENFDWASYYDALGEDYAKIYRAIVLEQGEATARAYGFDFDPKDAAMDRAMTSYVGERIVQLEATTREEVSDLVRRVLDANDDTDGTADSTRALGDKIAEAVRDKFDNYAQYRADRIARTETAIAYNHGTLLSSAAAGFANVEVADGDNDEECAAANGQVWPIDKAMEEPIAHPNCTRVFAPTEDDATEE